MIIFIFFPVIPPIVPNTGPEKPKLDHHQTDTTFTLSIFTRRKKLLEQEHIIIDYIEPNLLHILLRLLDDQTAYNIAYRYNQIEAKVLNSITELPLSFPQIMFFFLQVRKTP